MVICNGNVNIIGIIVPVSCFFYVYLKSRVMPNYSWWGNKLDGLKYKSNNIKYKSNNKKKNGETMVQWSLPLLINKFIVIIVLMRFVINVVAPSSNTSSWKLGRCRC